MTSAHPDPLINLVLQSCRLIEKVGSGAVADVYRAEDINTGQSYAVKVMQERWLPFPHILPRFESEARILFELQHLNIVVAYPPLAYVDIAPSRPYFIMEYLAGGSFTSFRRSGQPLTFGQAADFVELIADALHFAHEHGVIHRDLKPSNIMLRDAQDLQSAVLTDFGIAKTIHQSQMTNLINQPGTPEYMSPEQFQAQEATPLSDQYSMGVLLYWTLTGVLPFNVLNPTPIAVQHQTIIPPLPSTLNGDISPALDRVVMQALAKDPELRHRDMMQMAAAFKRAVHASHLEDTLIDISRRPSNSTNVSSSSAAKTPRESNAQHAVAQGAGTRPSGRPAWTGWVGAGVALLLIVSTLAAVFSSGTPAPTPGTMVAMLTEEIVPTASGLVSLTDEIDTTATPVTLATQTPMPTNTETPVLMSTERPASATPTLLPATSVPASATVPATATDIPTTMPVPALDEVLTTFNGGLGTALTFNCKRFVEMYETLHNNLDTADSLYESARTLTDEPDDYAVQIYEDYCRSEAANTTVRIDTRLFSSFRSEILQLLGS